MITRSNNAQKPTLNSQNQMNWLFYLSILSGCSIRETDCSIRVYWTILFIKHMFNQEETVILKYKMEL